MIYDDDFENKISWTVTALKIIGWIDFGVGILILFLAAISQHKATPLFSFEYGFIMFFQGVIVCALLNAIAAIVTYLYDIKNRLDNKEGK
jgi:hypothetical protein